jgi:hypothetical protein
LYLSAAQKDTDHKKNMVRTLNGPCRPVAKISGRPPRRGETVSIIFEDNIDNDEEAMAEATAEGNDAAQEEQGEEVVADGGDGGGGEEEEDGSQPGSEGHTDVAQLKKNTGDGSDFSLMSSSDEDKMEDHRKKNNRGYKNLPTERQALCKFILSSEK